MGASGWSYFTEYREDPNEALQELRSAVFERGEYAEPWDVEEDYAPSSIADLINDCAEDGTHSILDIERAAQSGEELTAHQWFGTLFPLSDDELDDIFGTRTPSHADAEEHAAEVMQLRDRWQGSWVVVYDGDTPTELFFAGFSGD